LNRAHQDKLTLLEQEMSVIRETLQQQRRILGFCHLLDRGQSTLARVNRLKYMKDDDESIDEPCKSTKHALWLYLPLLSPLKLTITITVVHTTPGTSIQSVDNKTSAVSSKTP
jgi:hypothetical protein